MKFLLTGTQAYGPLTSKSDWDIVMLREDSQKLKELLYLLQIEVHRSDHIHPSYEGFYFKFNQHEKVQIIVAGDEVEYLAWIQATNEMRKRHKIVDRRDRISTFQNFFYNALSNIRKKEYEKSKKLF